MVTRIAASCWVAALVSACGAEHPIIETCEAAGDIRVVCGMQNPEDMALLSDGRHLLVSQFGLMDGSRAGNLVLLDAVLGTHRVIFEASDDSNWTSGDAQRAVAQGWGDASCPGPPPAAFSPHGLDLAPRPDGTLRLLVVNHGGRESIEFFEVGDAGAHTRIAWRGCAIPPEDAYLNDVVNLPDGGFLTTHMLERSGELSGLVRAYLGFDTGFVYAWSPGSAFEVVDGTHGPFPNGIELSADGSEIYLNLYAAGEVRRIDRATGELLARVDVASPDNSSWAKDGRLLVASHGGGLADQVDCYGLNAGACPLQYEIVALDPKTLERSTVFSHAGPPMGAGTIAIDLGDALVIGTFAGDRAIIVPNALRADVQPADGHSGDEGGEG